MPRAGGAARAVLVGTVAVAMLGSGGPRPTGAAALAVSASGAGEEPGHGLTFRLSEGGNEPERIAPVARPRAERLSEAEAERLLDRLPAPAALPREEPFARREDSLPPPRSGRILAQPFPPASRAERATPPLAEELEVLRHQPDGEVAIAPALSVTFSQPMVALDTHVALASEAVPVRLTPTVPGEWRWVGTRTLVFEPKGRFPMATEYRAVVPAGTRGATGGPLAADVAWTFATPAPRLVARYPESQPARPASVVFAAFEQRIDPAAVLGSVRLRAGGAAVPVRLATAEEQASDEAVAPFVREAGPGRFLAFVPQRPLPPDTAVEVVIGPGTPSAEGPRRTERPQGWSFRTYGAFRVRHHECGWKGRCTPLQPWRVVMTNPLDAKSVRRDRVRVSPELPGLKVSTSGDNLTVHGLAKGRTTYTVTLSSEIQDVFGQALQAGKPLTFSVGPADPVLSGPSKEFLVLDPMGPRSVPVYSVNQPRLRVKLLAVSPRDWPAWQEYRQKAWRNEPASPPGRAVVERILTVAGPLDELVETRIDLTPALADGLGQVAVIVEPATTPRGRRNDAVRLWAQSTRIGLDAFVDEDALLAWATTLDDGRPLREVKVTLLGGASAQTDGRGLARLPLASKRAALVTAQLDKDLAILPAGTSLWDTASGWRRGDPVDSLRFCVLDDRGLYKPGEEVRLKGWLRRIARGPRGDVEPLPSGIDTIAWTLRDSQGNEVGTGTARLGGLGAFDLALKLPPTMNLGNASLELAAEGGGSFSDNEYTHDFQVQEFRRPEFEVKASASEGPHVVGGRASVTVSASYYAGGPLPNAEVRWRGTSRPASFRPPNRPDFSFGRFVPWWTRSYGQAGPTHVETLSSQTDATGRHVLRVDLDRAEPPRPHHLLAEATVMDVNRQAWTASAQLLVHPSLAYVGLRSEKPFVQKGEPIVIDAIVTDLDGAALAGRPIRVRLERLDWEQVEGEWKEVSKDAQETTVSSGADPVRARFEVKEGGSWRVVSRVEDDAGRPNETELRVWVAGGRVPPRRDLTQDQVTLIPDKKEYAAGDIARVLVVAPFAPAEGLLTLRRSGLLREERFTIGSGSRTLEIPIEEGFTPGVTAQVSLVGAAPRDEAGAAGRGARSRPAFASGSVDLAVPPVSRTLAVTVAPRESALAPGGSTAIELALREASGRPVANGEATVIVVDEAVLALTDYELPDPLGVFYAKRPARVSDHRLRNAVLLAKPEDLARPESGIRGGVVGGVVGGMMDRAMPAAPVSAMAEAVTVSGEAAQPIRARSDFSALALFAATVPTDAEGRAVVPVKLPDNLTRYRVMAVAVAGTREFGSAEATLTARLPLMVRPSAPRFLNFGDRFELPVVVQNQTDRALGVEVAVRAQNAALTAGAGRRLLVPANDRAEVRFPMAAERAGTARIQVAAAAGDVADAADVELPVWTPATTEAFATYGYVDRGAIVQPVHAPAGVVPQFGGLEITTSSTALQALTDAVLYLVAYPFECSEQLSSRVLAVAALRDVLAAFDAQGLPKPDEIEAAVKRDLERLRALQNEDGGFGFWRRGEESWPYVSIHVAHALARAKAKGFTVPDSMLERSSRYLREIDRRIPLRYPRDVRQTLVAYSLYVRALLGEGDPGRARTLVRAAAIDRLSFEALGFVLPTLSKDPASAAEVAAIRRRLANAVEETASAAHFTVSYGDGEYLLLHSDRRADAILLEALIADQPESDLVRKLVEGLLAHRTAGRWTNTQENVFVLLALDRYFQTYEKTTPDFVARLWLGDRYAGEHAFHGRTTERQHVAIPMAALRETASQDLLLSKQGPGRLYYRVGLRYAPESLVLEPLDRGFTVERAYEAVDDPKDVRHDEDGTWRIRAGARVRVRLTMVAPARRYHVALVDPLPAGLEALNPALATTGSLPEGGGSEVTPLAAPGLGGRPGLGSWWWWPRPWFEHQNLRDERVEAFSSLLWEGVHEYRYVARATTPGTFVVPPTKAEEMYAPETFGRGATDHVVVE